MKERPIIFSPEMIRAILNGIKSQTRRVVSRGNSFTGDGVPWDRLVWADAELPGHLHSFADNGYLHVPGRPHKDEPQDNFDYWARHRVYPQWEVGERLWVRETWAVNEYYDGRPKNECGPIPQVAVECQTLPDAVTVLPGRTHRSIGKERGRWRSPIHMPRWASRITLEITGVRVERLQNISAADAKAEGITDGGLGGWHWLPHPKGQPVDFGAWDYKTPEFAYQALWESIHREHEPKHVRRRRAKGKPANRRRTSNPHSWNANPWVWVIEFKRVTSDEKGETR